MCHQREIDVSGKIIHFFSQFICSYKTSLIQHNGETHSACFTYTNKILHSISTEFQVIKPSRIQRTLSFLFYHVHFLRMWIYSLPDTNRYLPANIHLLKFSKRNSRKRGLDMLKVNNKDTRMTHILHLFLVFLLVTLNGYICYVVSSLQLSLIRMNFNEYEL